jgi:quercetin dioxygenase-like cupin family protein
MTGTGASDDDSLDVDCLAHTVGPAFRRCLVEVPPGDALQLDPASWRDAIVFVLAGQVDVRCSGGIGHQFRQGDILCFARPPVRSVRNPGRVPARLLAIWRRTTHR